MTGDSGETVVVVLPHACFRAFLVLPCARILLLIGGYAGYPSVVRRIHSIGQEWESSLLQRHWCMVGGAVKTDVEKGIM